MVICLERVADLHMSQLMPLPFTVSCFSKIKIGFTFRTCYTQDGPAGPTLFSLFAGQQLNILDSQHVDLYWAWSYNEYYNSMVLGILNRQSRAERQSRTKLTVKLQIISAEHDCRI